MDFRSFAIATAQTAGQILIRHHGKPQTLEWKTLTNFKTAVDDESDAFIRTAIERQFPAHRIYSEEQAPKETSSPYLWVVDPLDGTIPYSTGLNDTFSVSIALCEEDVPILGVIYAPKRWELYVAERGKGAFLNYGPIRVSTETDINHVLMELHSGKEDRLALVPIYERLLGPDGIAFDVKDVAAAVGLAFVACGRLHAYAATSPAPEDVAAAVVLNREAGARVTTLRGNEWHLNDSDPSILVANPELHAKLLERLR